MKKDAIIRILASILVIIVGFFLSTIPFSNPTIELGRRLGQSFLITITVIIIRKILLLILMKNYAPTVESLFSQESHNYYFPPWIIRKRMNMLKIDTDRTLHISILVILTLICCLILYIILPSLNDFAEGNIMLSAGTLLSLAFFTFLLALVFMVVSLYSIFKGFIRVIDKNDPFIRIYRGRKSGNSGSNSNARKVSIPLKNLSLCKVKFEDYHQILIPIEFMEGDRKLLKNWITDDKLIFIQSHDETFIKNLHASLLKFLEIKG